MSKDHSSETKNIVFVVGDVMLDKYIHGVVNRISPEAPVPILEMNATSERPGGAANVALNLNGLNIKTILFSVIGKDNAADSLITFLQHKGLSTEGFLNSSSRKTSEKIRIMSNGQHLLRIDNEDIHPLSKEEEKKLLQVIQDLWEKYSPKMLVLQDYNKGVLTSFLINALIKLAKKKLVPVAVDPKNDHFWDFKEVAIFKPNRREIQKNIPFQFHNNRTDLKKVSDYIFAKLNSQIAVITLGENGIWLANRNSSIWIKGIKQEIIDVCGAGDSVIACLVWAFINNYDLETMGKLANAAGAQVCSRSGVVSLEMKSFWSFYLNSYTK
ncbi:MAG: hypothetical protein RLZZ417_1298 [Bacteroidota bacterium]|jgi:rfaE bifunctional protein kinase chain/domain